MARDPWSTLLVTVGAAVLLVILAYTLSIEIRQVPVVVWDGDRSPRSRAYLDAFRVDDFFDLRYDVLSIDEARALVLHGQARIAILIPYDFERRLLRGQTVRVQFIVDGSQPNIAIQALAHLSAISDRFALELVQSAVEMVGVPAGPGENGVRTTVRYNPGLKTVHGVLPGLMSIVLAMPAIATALSIAREKEQGTLEGLIATPLTRWQLLIGKITPYIIVGLVDIALFTAIGRFGFDIPFRGRLIHLFLLSGLFLLANLGIGLFIATLVGSQQAVILLNFVIFVVPPMIISGLFFPRYSMPWWLQVQSFFLPATHYVTISRGIFLKGVGLSVLWPNAAFLLVFGSLLLAGSTWRFRKRLA